MSDSAPAPWEHREEGGQRSHRLHNTVTGEGFHALNRNSALAGRDILNRYEARLNANPDATPDGEGADLPPGNYLTLPPDVTDEQVIAMHAAVTAIYAGNPAAGSSGAAVNLALLSEAVLNAMTRNQLELVGAGFGLEGLDSLNNKDQVHAAVSAAVESARAEAANGAG